MYVNGAYFLKCNLSLQYYLGIEKQGLNLCVLRPHDLS